MPDNARCSGKTQPTSPHVAKSLSLGTQSPGSCLSLLLQQLEVAQELPSSWQQTWAPSFSSTGNLLGFWDCSPALSQQERCCLLHMYWMFPGRNKTKLNNSRELKMAGEECMGDIPLIPTTTFLPLSCVSAPGKPTKNAKVFPHCSNKNLACESSGGLSCRHSAQDRQTCGVALVRDAPDLPRWVFTEDRLKISSMPWQHSWENMSSNISGRGISGRWMYQALQVAASGCICCVHTGRDFSPGQQRGAGQAVQNGFCHPCKG